MKQNLTFLQCLDHLHLTVSSLELIEEGAHFELVNGAFLQLTNHHAILRRGTCLQDTPLPVGLAVLSRDPVENLVTLDVWGLLFDLTEIKNTLGKCQTT